MGDFLLELLFLFAEVILEALFEFALVAAFDLIFRAIAVVFEISELTNPLLACVGYVLLGGATGGLSLLLYPHPLFHPSRIHGISLVVSPILTGLAMWQVGSFLRTKNKKVIRIESFWYGFAFAAGMALARFSFTK